MKRQRGTTLIELMVALTVGMLIAVGVFSIMGLAEGRRRATTTVNTLNADGLVAASHIETWLRSVGSGLSPSANFAYGCMLQATKKGSVILPLPKALPAPFGAFDKSTPVRMAPVVIWPDNNTPADSGQTSDVLMLMSSGTGGGALPVAFDVSPDAKTIYLKHHALDFNGQDLLLIAETQSMGTAATDCAITQVQSKFTAGVTRTLPLDGDYAPDLSGFSGDAVALNLGNLPRYGTATANSAQGGKPHFMLVGVGDHSTLYTYDLLQGSSDDEGAEMPAAVAGGVLEMHALYGIGENDDGKMDRWVKPENDYAPKSLLDGSPKATQNLKRIKAIKVGLILRTTLPDRVEATPGSPRNKNAVISATAPTLFADLGKDLSFTHKWGGANAPEDEQLYRYRTVELVLPLRNAIMVEAP
jgi:type IV pilus assembly protein PilW